MKREYKPDYDKAFRDEHIKWFEERMDRLPKSLQINDAMYSSNLELTVKGLMRTLRNNVPNVTFSGYMNTLLQIREKLEEQGL